MRYRVEVKRNAVDRVIEFLDPVRARNRLQARMQLAIAGQWTGGRTDRRETRGWTPFGGSADADDQYDLDMLRRRSRDLQRNAPIAVGAINTNVTSIVGTGLALRARPDAVALGWTPEQAKTWRAGVEREFRLWAESPVACDAEATLDFYHLQALVLRSCLESGDVFATMPMALRPGSAYALKLLVIEADRVSNKDRAPDSDRLVDGVQKGPLGEPVAYHVNRRHPGALGLSTAADQWDVIPAFGARSGRRNVLHLYDKRRPGKTRGTPYLAPVIEVLKQVSDYKSHEIQAAVIGSLFTVFVRTNSGAGLDLDADGVGATTQQASATDVKMGAGAIIDLAKNEDVQFANPGRPNSAAEVFIGAMLREIGTALELPYEVLMKAFESSYSAARAALLEAWRFFKVRRAWLAMMFCQPVYEAWLEEAVARGRVDAPGFFDDPALRAAYAGAEWIGDGPGQIDPLKEVQAARERIDGNLSNHTLETLEMRGMDWAEVHEQLQAERALIGPTASKPAAPADDDPDQMDADEMAEGMRNGK